MVSYSFNWLKEANNMYGQIQLEQFAGLKDMPQKAASAWYGAELDKLMGANYKPLVYLGSQTVNGTLHWFIAEQFIPYKFEIRHVIKLAILEKDGQYTFDDDTVSKIV